MKYKLEDLDGMIIKTTWSENQYDLKVINDNVYYRSINSNNDGDWHPLNSGDALNNLESGNYIVVYQKDVKRTPKKSSLFKT